MVSVCRRRSQRITKWSEQHLARPSAELEGDTQCDTGPDDAAYGNERGYDQSCLLIGRPRSTAVPVEDA